MNIRISTDGGESWDILSNPSPEYDNSSVFSFDLHLEGTSVPGWTGLLDDWTQVTHDLSAYQGQTVQIRFAFASDLDNSTEVGSEDWFGWQLDNIEIINDAMTL